MQVKVEKATRVLRKKNSLLLNKGDHKIGDDYPDSDITSLHTSTIAPIWRRRRRLDYPNMMKAILCFESTFSIEMN